MRSIPFFDTLSSLADPIFVSDKGHMDSGHHRTFENRSLDKFFRVKWN